VVWVGLVIGLMALGSGAFFHDPAQTADKRWQTVIFTALAFMQMGQALASRSRRTSLWSLGFLSNPLLLGLVALTVVLQLIAVYAPFLDRFFQVTPLSALELSLCVALGVAVLLLIELEKAWLRRHGSM